MNSQQSETAPIICVTGGSGFIGSHLLHRLRKDGASIRMLSRSATPASADGVQVHVGDLFNPHSLIEFLHGADVLINLAQPAESIEDRSFIQAMTNLAEGARTAGIRRLVHVSTAMVIGIPRSARVDEDSQCNPATPYERQKLAAEQTLLGTLQDRVDVGILRPTAVFGPGGKNLLKLCTTIQERSPLQRALLRLFHGHRHMHLVSVYDVVEAILFLTFSGRALAGNIFLISADHEPDNNYQAVDAILGHALGKPAAKRTASLPRWVLRTTLRLIGRSQTDPNMVYDASKLRSWGFCPTTEFTDALKQFASAVAQDKRAG